MDIFGVFHFLGGIALFLFGMRTMGDAIAREAGGRMRTVLEHLTSSRTKSLILGTGVAAVIQSSAATCVMVLGFVSSGIISLSGSVAVIMGANIGTCATAWLLSLNSITGDSFVLRLINPDSFVPVLAAAGAFIILFTKNERRKDAALVMLGFSVLMYGMDFITSSLEPAVNGDQFRRLLTLFSNPFVGIVIGIAIAVITQSSSASIGILQAVSAVGAVPFNTALPLIVGMNIGAMVIVLFSSIGGSRDVKRAALISLLYNITGGVVVQLVWSLLYAAFRFPLGELNMGYISVAVTHTVYKTVIALIQIPFIPALVKLSRFFVPEGPEEEKFEMLDELLLKTPSVAIGLCTELTCEMANLTRDNFMRALKLLRGYDAAEAKKVAAAEDTIDMYEDKLGSYMAKLSGKHLNPSDSSEITRLLHCIGDFERIGDHAMNICETAEEKHDKNLHFSEAANAELEVMYKAVSDIVDLTMEAFTENRPAVAAHIEPLEEAIDRLTDQLKTRHISRLQHGECTVLLGFVFQDIITDLERVSDHCSNVGICIIQTGQSSHDAHLYINNLMASDDPAFKSDFELNLDKYSLPETAAGSRPRSR